MTPSLDSQAEETRERRSMSGEEAKLRFDAAAKAIKDGKDAQELIALCLPSDQNVLRERLRTSAKTNEAHE